MRSLIDTNVLSELRKGQRGDRGVRSWFEATADDDMFTSVLVLGEVRHGIELVRRHDVASALAIEQWLLRLAASFQDRILGVDIAIAQRWGALNVPDPVPTVDGLLAATALEYDLVLVTRNTRDVAATGVRSLDPFTDRPS